MSEGNFFDGSAGSVFQGRDVYGGVHFQQPALQVVPPVQVLEPPRHYRNNERQLAELSRVRAEAEAGGGVGIAIVRGVPGSGRSTLCECWAFRNQELFDDGVFPVRLGRRPVTDVLADLLALAGYTPQQWPQSLEGRSAMWRAWTGKQRLALLVDDAMSATEVRALLPAGAGSMVLVVEAGRLTELKTRHSAQEVELDPLSDEAAHGVLAELVGVERLDAESQPRNELIRICAGSAAELTVAGAMLAESPNWTLERLIGRIRRKGSLASPVFDVAYDRLPEDAQACYRIFGAHPGDGDVALETLMAVLGLDIDDAEDAVGHLVAAKLVEPMGADRYRMADLARLHAGTLGADLPAKVVAYYAKSALEIAENALDRGWAGQLWPGFVPDGRDRDRAQKWLRTERLNLVAAAETAYQEGALEDVCRLALALWAEHKDGGYPAEMVAVNQDAVSAARAWNSPLAESILLTQLGFAAAQRRDWATAYEHHGRAAELAELANSVEARATAVESLGLAYFEASAHAQPEEAERLLAAAEERLRLNLGLAEQLGVDRRLALARMHLAKVARPAEAAELLAEASGFLDSEPGNRAKVLLWRGRKAVEDGALDDGVSWLLEVVDLAAKGGWHRERIMAGRTLAEAALAKGERASARAHAEDALNVARLRGYTAEALDIMEWLDQPRF
ncbi:hypothetical protein [Amycolatopsis saalfeldensis]|uniref:NB-ARC domain-containing protein n=1 Tax=Amycolatopsis saalfeldensis TaxID=394193 RepID=A0A1H8YIQ1_9PSEU|nr:hypothetical protein [Amycolatopsis saalfeldensis]SEP51911.1 hypothetical protein SAMN04489732_1183 [Amycolatopsis saalfeldensis]